MELVKKKISPGKIEYSVTLSLWHATGIAAPLLGLATKSIVNPSSSLTKAPHKPLCIFAFEKKSIDHCLCGATWWAGKIKGWSRTLTSRRRP
jgi:hypothetical protein